MNRFSSAILAFRNDLWSEAALVLVIVTVVPLGIIKVSQSALADFSRLTKVTHPRRQPCDLSSVLPPFLPASILDMIRAACSREEGGGVARTPIEYGKVWDQEINNAACRASVPRDCSSF